MKERLGVIAIILVGVIGAAALILGVVLISGRQDRLCQVLRGQIEASAATIGKKGAPGYSYYKRHPDEAAAARKANAKIVKALDFCSVPKPPQAAAPQGQRQPSKPRARGTQRRRERDMPSSGDRVAQLRNGTRKPYPARPERDTGLDTSAPVGGGDQGTTPEPAPRPVPPEGLPGPGGPPPGEPAPPPREHGHERSALERACDVVDQLVTNAC